MSGFSSGDAVGSGFGLISRRPLSVSAWAVVYLVLVVVPALVHSRRSAGLDRHDRENARAPARGRPAGLQRLPKLQPADGARRRPDVAVAVRQPDRLRIRPRAVYRSCSSPEQELRLAASGGAGAVAGAAVHRRLLDPAGDRLRPDLDRSPRSSSSWRAAGHAMSQPLAAVVALLIAAICIGRIAAFLWICISFSLAGP